MLFLLIYTNKWSRFLMHLVLLKVKKNTDKKKPYNMYLFFFKRNSYKEVKWMRWASVCYLYLTFHESPTSSILTLWYVKTCARSNSGIKNGGCIWWYHISFLTYPLYNTVLLRKSKTIIDGSERFLFNHPLVVEFIHYFTNALYSNVLLK